MPQRPRPTTQSTQCRAAAAAPTTSALGAPARSARPGPLVGSQTPVLRSSAGSVQPLDHIVQCESLTVTDLTYGPSREHRFLLWHSGGTCIRKLPSSDIYMTIMETNLIWYLVCPVECRGGTGDLTEAASRVNQTPRTYWLCTSERKPSCSISKHGEARETTCRQAWFNRSMLPDHSHALDKLEEAHNQLGEPGDSPPAREAQCLGFS